MQLFIDSNFPKFTVQLYSLLNRHPSVFGAMNGYNGDSSFTHVIDRRKCPCVFVYIDIFAEPLNRGWVDRKIRDPVPIDDCRCLFVIANC